MEITTSSTGSEATRDRIIIDDPRAGEPIRHIEDMSSKERRALMIRIKEMLPNRFKD